MASKQPQSTEKTPSSDSSPVEARLSRLEASIRQPNRRLGIVAMLMVLALLTGNVWLVWSQVANQQKNSNQAAFWELCHSGTTPQIRTERFLQLVAVGNEEWRSAILDGLQLAGTDLSDRNVTNARFSDCDLNSTVFVEAELNNAAFNLCNCEDADFTDADLRNVSFFKANLQRADFRNTNLKAASLEQCQAQNARFVTADMGDCFLAMADLSDADLTGADLTGADLTAATLVGANLALANLSNTYLEDTNLSDSNWWRARGLSSAEMQRLALRYPPTQNAEESRRRDFRIWLGNQQPPDEN